MIDLERALRDRMQRTADGLQHTPDPTPGLVRRARLRRAGTAIVAGVAVLAVVVGGFAATRSLFNDPAIPPAKPGPDGIFADVHGWIAYGNESGIWAVDPAQPGDPDDRVQLSSKPGIPRAWSPDGSKLLVVGAPNAEPEDLPVMDLFVMNADGTETLLAHATFESGGAFTPDGSQVVYAAAPDDDDGDDSSIYVIDAEGGAPQLVLAAGRRRFPSEDRSFETALYAPTLSPDGSQIAYFDGMGDWGHSLRVMNSDGTGMRVVVENSMTLRPGHVFGLDWSPDGQQLVFAIRGRGVYVVGTDGSELRLVAKDGLDPHWSPDGSRISYVRSDPTSFERLGLGIITLNSGQHVQQLGLDLESGPWNPLDPSTTGDANE